MTPQIPKHSQNTESRDNKRALPPPPCVDLYQVVDMWGRYTFCSKYMKFPLWVVDTICHIKVHWCKFCSRLISQDIQRREVFSHRQDLVEEEKPSDDMEEHNVEVLLDLTELYESVKVWTRVSARGKTGAKAAAQVCDPPQSQRSHDYWLQSKALNPHWKLNLDILIPLFRPACLKRKLWPDENAKTQSMTVFDTVTVSDFLVHPKKITRYPCCP